MATASTSWGARDWLEPVDPRPLALFRIGLGLVLLQDLFDRALQLREFLTDQGAVPRSALAGQLGWSVFQLTGEPALVGVLFAGGALAVVALLLGYRTRLATVLSWAFLVSLHARNPYIEDSGDDLARILLFWAAFTDLGGCWSLDARRRGPSRAPAAGFRFMQLHLVLFYALTGYLKLRNGWLEGTNVYKTLQLIGYLRPLGAWLGQHALPCLLLTYATLVVELAFPVLMLVSLRLRWVRALAVASIFGLQLGLFVSLRVGIFSELMMCACLLFVRPEWLDSIAPIAEPPQRPGRTRLALLIILGLQFAATLIEPDRGYSAVFGRSLPRLARREASWLGIWQTFDLFSRPLRLDRWSAPGVLADGSPVDAVPAVAPGMRPAVGLHFDRWFKLTLKRDLHFDALGAFFCRRYGELNPGSPLSRFRFVRTTRDAAAPGQPPAPEETEVLWVQSCPPRR